MSRFLLNYAGQEFEVTGEEAQAVRTAMENLSTTAGARTALVSLQTNELRDARHLLFLTLGVPIFLTEQP